MQLDYLEVTADYMPQPRFGMGIQASLVAGGLARIGRSVAVATTHRPGDSDMVDDIPVIRADRGFDELDGLVLDLARGEQLEKKLDDLGVTAKIVHNHNFATVPLACRLSEKWRSPLVSSVHVVDDLFDEMQGSSRPRTAALHLLKALERHGLAKSDLIVPANEFIGQKVRESVPECADRIVTLAHPRHADVPAKRSYDGHSPMRLLFVGRLISYKGVGQLLAAMKMLPPGFARLTIVGDGPMRGEVEAAVRSGLGIDWRPRLPNATVVTLYGEADLFVFPSVLEIHPVVIQEAMHAGTPIVAGDIGPVRAQADAGVEAVLLPVRLAGDGASVDPADIAAAIVDLADHPETRAELGANARRRALATADPVDYARAFHDICAERL